MAVSNDTSTSRLNSLIYKMLTFFRLGSDGEVKGINISKADLNRAVSPNNLIIGDGVSKIVVSATPPASPQIGDLWIDIS